MLGRFPTSSGLLLLGDARGFLTTRWRKNHSSWGMEAGMGKAGACVPAPFRRLDRVSSSIWELDRKSEAQAPDSDPLNQNLRSVR